MALDAAALTQLKDSLDVEQFVRDHFDRISGASPQMYARCPAHADHRNSLSICVDGPNRGAWTCHAGCGPESRRDIINLVMMMHSSNFGEALGYLQEYIKEGHVRKASSACDSFPVESDTPFKADTAQLEQCAERLTSKQDWMDFLAERKISQKIAIEFKLGVDSNSNLVIPTKHVFDGEVKGIRFRAMDGSRWWFNGSKASQILYGSLRPTERRVVYVTEGETDALSLLSSDSLTSAVCMFGARVAWREEWSDGLKTFKTEKVVLCGDNDRAGRNMNQEVFNSLTQQGFSADQIFIIDWDRIAEALVLPELPEKYDINAALQAGLNFSQLEVCVKPYPTVGNITAAPSKPTFSMQAPVPDEPTIELPDSAWPPMLAEMRDALHLRLPTPDPIIMGGLLALISHVVGRRVWTSVFGRHVPAIYSMSIADTNIGKSAILDYMSNELFPKLDQKLRNIGTPINKYGSFASAEGVGKAFEEVSDNRILQIAGEYSIQLQKARSEGGGPVVQALSDLWQGSSQGSISKVKGWDLSGKHLSVAAGTTKVWLHTYMRREDIMGGYANRFCYWIGERHQARRVYITADPDPRVVEDFCQNLYEMSGRIGPHALQPQILVNPTTEAKDLAVQWMESFERELDGMDEMQRLVSIRVPAHIARIATLFALFDQNTQITATQMRRAIEVGDYLKKTVWHVFHDYGMSGPTACATYIFNKIEENGGKLNKRLLQQSIPGRYREHLTKAISDLQRQGILLEENNGKMKFWTLAAIEDQG